MTLDEMKRVLAAIALGEYRFGKPNNDVLKWWHSMVGDVDLDEALEAVRRYYGSEATDRIMPGHIRQGVNALRAERRRAEPAPARALPSRFEPDVNREVRMARGAASAREVLEPLLEHVGRNRPELPSALDELRALTSEPFGGDIVDAEVVE